MQQPPKDTTAKPDTQATGSQLLITFEGPGAAGFAMQWQNVTPAQMLGLSAYLDWYAKRELEKVVAANEAKVPRLLVPSMMPGVH